MVERIKHSLITDRRSKKERRRLPKRGHPIPYAPYGRPIPENPHEEQSRRSLVLINNPIRWVWKDRRKGAKPLIPEERWR